MQQPVPPATTSLSVQHAWQLLRLHRPELALRMADQLLARDPVATTALIVRAEALRQLRRLPEAVKTARQAVALAPQVAGTFATLARAYGQQGELYEAELAIKEALRLTPTEASYHAFLAELQYLLRRPAEAAVSAQNGLFLNPEHANCLLWVAMAQEALSQPEAADKAFGRLLHVAPTSDQAHAQLGRILLLRYEPAAADRHLTEALRQAPGRAPELLPLLRRARRRQHWPAWLLRSERARRERQAQDRDPSLRMAANWLLLGWAVAWAHWRTRHDPLFQLSPRQVWQRRLRTLGVGVLLLPLLILGGDYLNYFDAAKPLGMPQMVGLAIAGLLVALSIQLMKRKIDSLETHI